MENLLKPNQFQPQDIQYSKSQGTSIRVALQKKPIRIQVTKAEYSLPMKFDKFRLNLFLDGYTDGKTHNQSHQIQILQDKLLELDQSIPKLAYKHRKRWFTEDLWDESLETFQENYYSLVQTDKVTNRNCLKLNLFNTNSNLSCETYNENKELMTDPIAVLQELAFSDNLLSGIIQSKYIWINEEAFGMNWEILQMKINPIVKMPIGSNILAEYDDVIKHEFKPIDSLNQQETKSTKLLASNEKESPANTNNSESQDVDLQQFEVKQFKNYLLEED